MLMEQGENVHGMKATDMQHAIFEMSNSKYKKTKVEKYI